MSRTTTPTAMDHFHEMYRAIKHKHLCISSKLLTLPRDVEKRLPVAWAILVNQHLERARKYNDLVAKCQRLEKIEPRNRSLLIALNIFVLHKRQPHRLLEVWEKYNPSNLLPPAS